jgi:two-component system cell cycle sensor histidine kinase/response regulator CckA
VTTTVIALAAVSTWLVLVVYRLRKRSELYRQAFLASPTPAAVTTEADGTFLEVNRSFEQLLQYTREELIGHRSTTLGIWLSPSDRADVLAAIAAAGRVRALPVRFRRRDGERLHVLFSSERVEIDGRPALLSMLHDVTAQKQAEERQQRIDAQGQEARRLEAIGQLAGGIAHDFNNVLQAVKGYTELAVDSLPAGHPALAQLDQVSEAADRAATFTAQLLTFSRRDTPAFATLDLNHIVADTGVLLRHSLGGHIQVVTHTGASIDAIEGNRGQIEQILMSLCINARDAMPEGGRVTIATGQTEFTEQDCRVRTWARSGRWVFIRVTDTGTGITDDIRARMFEPFFTTKPAGRGAGLGLSTVYAITERHGGLIEVDTEPGRGSTFTIYFPSAGIAHARDDRPARADVALQGRGESILIAEDEPFVRDLAVEMLQGANYRVVVAADGAEAESIIADRGAAIDAAVLDVVMPQRNGRQVYETLQRVRGRVPVVFCSGYAFGELSDIEQLAGASVLAKPYTRAALLTTVRRALDEGR